MFFTIRFKSVDSRLDVAQQIFALDSPAIIGHIVLGDAIDVVFVFATVASLLVFAFLFNCFVSFSNWLVFTIARFVTRFLSYRNFVC